MMCDMDGLAYAMELWSYGAIMIWSYGTMHYAPMHQIMIYAALLLALRITGNYYVNINLGKYQDSPLLSTNHHTSTLDLRY